MKKTSPSKPHPRRVYLMALFGHRRKPTRVPKAAQQSALAQSREWWRVEATSAEAARELCLAWPSICMNTTARITEHGRNRS